MFGVAYVMKNRKAHGLLVIRRGPRTWYMPRLLKRGGGENVPDILGACATGKFTYLSRGPWCRVIVNGALIKSYCTSHSIIFHRTVMYSGVIMYNVNTAAYNLLTCRIKSYLKNGSAAFPVSYKLVISDTYYIAITHGCVRNDSETHETVLLDCTTGEAGSAI